MNIKIDYGTFFGFDILQLGNLFKLFKSNDEKLIIKIIKNKKIFFIVWFREDKKSNMKWIIVSKKRIIIFEDVSLMNLFNSTIKYLRGGYAEPREKKKEKNKTIINSNNKY